MKTTMAGAAVAAVGLLLFQCALEAQEIPEPRTVTEGPQAIVLGAGGSRGLAHAGVLVGLERKGYDPEIIVGASMGAVLGAHYAAGYPPEAVWRLITDVDWPETFSPLPRFIGPERALRHPILRTDRTKPDPTGKRTSRGLIPEWRINRLLVRNLFDAGVRSGGDFDRLPRRFRAVATDLETGELVVLGRGDLARAVRASMGIPAAFGVVHWDGRPYVDGGVADYLPVDVARSLGASHVIASDVLQPGERLEGASPMLVGLRGFRLLLRNVRDPRSAPDVLLLPDIVPTLTEATFPKDPTPLLEAGLAAVAELPSRDRPPPDEMAPVPARPPAADAPPGPGPPTRWEGPVAVEVADPALAALVERAFRSVSPGPYDPEAVLRAVDRLYATGLFEGVWPRAEPPAGERDIESEARLVVLADAGPRAALDAAGAYDTDRGLRGWASIERRFGTRRVAELSFTTTADRLRQEASTTARVHSRRWVGLAWTAGSHLGHTDAPLFEGGRRTGRARVERAGGWMGLEVRGLAPDWFLSAALRTEQIRGPEMDSGRAIGPLVRFGRWEPLNRLVGGPTDLQMEVRRGQVSYWKVRARGSPSGTTGSYSGALLADVAVAQEGSPLDVLPSLGHDQLVPGFRWGEERGRLRTAVGADLARSLAGQTAIRLRLRMGAAVQEASGLRERQQWVTGGELAFVRPTPLGPAVAGLSANTRGARRLELRLGPTF
jgi:predicted acylesterase/phospholipase RssA